jgi:mannan endo-1,4-beta-mannosidase
MDVPFEQSDALAEDHPAPGSVPRQSSPMPWIRVRPGVPYFETENETAWTPVGHNESITWPALGGTADQVSHYFEVLRASGVSCLRLMLEYAEDDAHYFESAVGSFNPRVVRSWDAMFALAEQYGIRFLLTPFDTFWMWKRWDCHPYNARHGGPCEHQRTLLTCPQARAAIKARLAFAIDRWSGSGALFAWDLWNEIHPAFSEEDASWFDDYISDMAAFVRARELSRYGRAHALTVSAFGPMLTDGFWSPELGQTSPDERAAHAIFRHPALDFATVHTYASHTIDDPADTVAPAIAMGTLTAAALEQITDMRPYFDSEHGPIHTFKDKQRVLPEKFDDEYFRHVQWAHLASGGAGGGMRWPNRSPHQLTPGMHAAQRVLADFAGDIVWSRFRRRNLTARTTVSPGTYAVFCCGDHAQAILWVLRRGPLDADGTLAEEDSAPVQVTIPGLASGTYEVICWDTATGCRENRGSVSGSPAGTRVDLDVGRDVAVIIRHPRAC